ncbi:phage late control D family protein [Tunturiibacter lichenicola]|uniref:phage late control D family protein n=1 Tax=Tunturiibacter lichenicola TaxID=2051959 RepID=UPI003D9B5659
MARYASYAPAFEVQISGSPLPAALQYSVVSINYQDGMEGADRVEVTFANPNLAWLDHPLLQIDNRFTLSIGYAPDPLERVFVGEITGVEPSFPSGGMPTIKVVAQDFLQRLTHGKADRAYYVAIPKMDNFPLPDIVVGAIVSGTNLLIPVPDPVGGVLSILMTLGTYVNVPGLMQKGVRRQESQSDFDFLSSISRQNGWEMYIDHTAQPQGYVLRFQFLLQDYAPSLTLKWGQTLMDFTPRITTVGDVFGISARIWIAAIKTEFVVVVGWDFDRATINLSVYPGIGSLDILLGANAAKTISIKPTGFPTALQSILGELLPRLNNRLTASGSTIGDPRIKASRVINIEGAGDQFGGLYRITQATHAFDSGGYRTSFQARKEVWFGSIPLPKSPANLVRLQGQRV